jgi:hypothetical protein
LGHSAGSFPSVGIFDFYTNLAGGCWHHGRPTSDRSFGGWPMGLVAYLVRVILRSTINLFFSLFVWIAQTILSFCWHISISFLRLMLRIFTAWGFLALNVLSLGSSEATERIASGWTQRLIEMGVSTNHIDSAYKLCRFLVACLITLGWILPMLMTFIVLWAFVEITIRVVFGIVF